MANEISKRVRAEAARIASFWASTPEWSMDWLDGRWSVEAQLLYLKAFRAAIKRNPVGGYQHPYDVEAHEAAAEAEALLRTGWTP